MEYSWTICYPDNEDIEEKGAIKRASILDTFCAYPWEDQLILLQQLKENVSYNPSIRFTCEDKYWLELTAQTNFDGSTGFSLWFNRPVIKKTLFGLLKDRNVFNVVDKEFSQESAITLLKLFIQKDYQRLNKHRI
ncbi:MAG: hypothetical protein JKY54_00500 [Flavobacteriales bacterium]|nr:hypothetical protein [Flavobacteriales bacterium]